MPLLYSAMHHQGGSFILKYLFPFSAVFSRNPPIRRALSKRGAAASHRNFTSRGFSTGCPHCVIPHPCGAVAGQKYHDHPLLVIAIPMDARSSAGFSLFSFSFSGKFIWETLTACVGLGRSSGKVLAKGLCSFQRAMRGLFYPLITKCQKIRQLCVKI